LSLLVAKVLSDCQLKLVSIASDDASDASDVFDDAFDDVSKLSDDNNMKNAKEKMIIDGNLGAAWRARQWRDAELNSSHFQKICCMWCNGVSCFLLLWHGQQREKRRFSREHLWRCRRCRRHDLDGVEKEDASREHERIARRYHNHCNDIDFA
jgi:hypothetical protein